MPTLDLSLPAGFYRLGGLNAKGIDVYHNGRDHFTADIGKNHEFDLVNENVNPYPTSEKRQRDLPHPRTPLASRRRVLSGRPVLTVDTAPDSTHTVILTPRWRSPSLSPSPSKSFILKVHEIPSGPTTPKAFRAVEVIDEVNLWTHVHDTPMTPAEQGVLFDRPNTPPPAPRHYGPLGVASATHRRRGSLTPTRPVRVSPYPNRRASLPVSMDMVRGGNEETAVLHRGGRSNTAPRGLRL
ncbi:hypothetical protein CC85DRAFT_301887 [Cutaneotrichosporon oleaginosum]|uniref:Uncharacterized protein n=1 Tax=Cutaneotrichosporon oleaginosum TaxID=879819 RepID=A0A0J0XP97_9TREE|nr:uncharacterized protein CC85DRAFT_301887 [Cutaneotrichosporon oleaginosum]KLT42925.1 hypothetical protein CC85DRAFT_301887 [Cutaneotrichosporon oleaginosum]TXT12628.1 hypothetical protein COLE_03038 [Cutaneotrichosporon oleaginosum]